MRRGFVAIAIGILAVGALAATRRAAGEAPPAGGTRADVLRLADGTVYLGTFRAFDGATIEFQAGDATLRLPRRDVVAILLSSPAEAQAAILTGAPSANPEAETAPDLGLTGLWNSPEWGAMRLVQKGRRIYGTYDWDGGQIDGYIQGDEIRFWWWELTPHGKPFADADLGQRGDGFFKISPDQRAFTGAWRYASGMKPDAPPTAAWTAQKQGPLPADFQYQPPAFAIPEAATKW
ncbi:MAG: hypothetical protein HY321_15045 [Armatimonadetes bacterium]|nr:hypothetical protein [Armatimonadota bacterium]